MGTDFGCHLGRNPESKRLLVNFRIDEAVYAALAFGIPAQMNGAQRRPCGVAKVRAHPTESV